MGAVDVDVSVDVAYIASVMGDEGVGGVLEVVVDIAGVLLPMEVLGLEDVTLMIFLQKGLDKRFPLCSIVLVQPFLEVFKLARLYDFWSRPEVRELIESPAAPRTYMDKLQAMVPSGYKITPDKIYKAKYALRVNPGAQHHVRHRQPKTPLHDRKLELAYEVLGLEVKEEVERQKVRARELEQRIKELEQTIQNRENRIKQLESDVRVTGEAYRKRALEVAGIVHGSRD